MRTSSTSVGSRNAYAYGGVLRVEGNEPRDLLVAAARDAHLRWVPVLRAKKGAEGVRLARTFRPHELLLDLRLPDRPGLEVARELDREISSEEIRLLVVTADKFSPDQVKAGALGARAVIFTPIDTLAFVDEVDEVAAALKGQRPSTNL